MNSEEYSVVLENVTYYYPNSSEPAIKNVNLRVKKGEFIVIAGPSGGGKSTLCKIMFGLIPHYYGGKLHGKVIVEGIDVVKAGTRSLVGKVGILFQIPENQLVNLLVEEEIAFGLENILLPPNVINERITWVLNALKISHLRRRLTYTLSGGEAQKVALASILAFKPRVLVLDEPLANLDPLSAREFIETLYRLWKENNITVILVEHRLSEVLKYVQRIIVLDKTIVAEGAPEELVEAGVLEKHGVEILPSFKPFEHLNVDTAPLNTSEAVKVFNVNELGAAFNNNYNNVIIKDPRRRDEHDEMHRPVIIIDDLWYKYPNGEYILKGINLKIYEGEFIAIVGANGAGKTTLIKHFNGLLKPSKGRVIVLGMDTREHSTAELARYVGIVFQNPLHQFFEEIIEKEIMFTAMNMKVGDIDQRVKEVLKELRIYHLRNRSPHEVSVGEQRRVAIASVLVYEPKIIVLDEPTAGLDYRLKKELLDIIVDKMLRKGKTVIMVSHDIEFLARAPLSRIVVMEKGKIALDASPREILYKISKLYTVEYTQSQVLELAALLGVKINAYSRYLTAIQGIASIQAVGGRNTQV